MDRVFGTDTLRTKFDVTRPRTPAKLTLAARDLPDDRALAQMRVRAAREFAPAAQDEDMTAWQDNRRQFFEALSARERECQLKKCLCIVVRPDEPAFNARFCEGCREDGSGSPGFLAQSCVGGIGFPRNWRQYVIGYMSLGAGDDGAHGWCLRRPLFGRRSSIIPAPPVACRPPLPQ
jgi:hypothetical protein